MSTFSFLAVAIGAALLGVAISVASKKGAAAAFALTLAGLVGVAYGFVDGGQSSVTNPPDVVAGSKNR